MVIVTVLLAPLLLNRGLALNDNAPPCAISAQALMKYFASTAAEGRRFLQSDPSAVRAPVASDDDS